MRYSCLLAALALSGCSLLGSDAAEIRAVVELPAAAATVDVTVTVDGREQPLQSSPTTSGSVLGSEPRSIGAGPTRLTCALARGGGASEAALTLDAADGWRYVARCAVRADDPTEGCFGCSRPAVTDLDPALGLGSDAQLWLFWTGEPEDGTVSY